MSETPRQEELDVLKSEHLAEGIRPIMACIGTVGDYVEEIGALQGIEEIGHHSDYMGEPESLNRRGFRADTANSGWPTYIMSPIDDKPKFTKRLFDCTSLIAVGHEKNSGKEVSLLTHQDPKWVLDKQKDSFEATLRERLKELEERCLEGTIDIVIAGGKLSARHPENYQNSLGMLSSLVREVFGFEPPVICGPKVPFGDKDDVYFDTTNRRLYVVRPNDGKFRNDVFKPSEIDKKREEWGVGKGEQPAPSEDPEEVI